jgi:hypothetical protein
VIINLVSDFEVHFPPFCLPRGVVAIGVDCQKVEGWLFCPKEIKVIYYRIRLTNTSSLVVRKSPKSTDAR